MFAVIKAGGKQYRVIEDQVLKVEGVQGEPGTIVQLGDVIMLGGDTPQIGSPMIEGASVAAEILDHVRGAKVIAFKKRRRKNSRRKRGHRQDFVLIRISEILTEGAKPTKGPKPKPEAKAKAPEAATEGEDGDEKPKAKKQGSQKAGQEASGQKARCQGKEKVTIRPPKRRIVAPAGFRSQASINICVMIPSRNRAIRRAS